MDFHEVWSVPAPALFAVLTMKSIARDLPQVDPIDRSTFQIKLAFVNFAGALDSTLKPKDSWLDETERSPAAPYAPD